MGERGLTWRSKGRAGEGLQLVACHRGAPLNWYVGPHSGHIVDVCSGGCDDGSCCVPLAAAFPAVLPMAAVHSLPGFLASIAASWRARRARVLPNDGSAPPGLRPRGTEHGLVCISGGRALSSYAMAFVAHLIDSHRVWPNPAFEGTRRCGASTCRMSARSAAQLVR